MDHLHSCYHAQKECKHNDYKKPPLRNILVHSFRHTIPHVSVAGSRASAQVDKWSSEIYIDIKTWVRDISLLDMYLRCNVYVLYVFMHMFMYIIYISFTIVCIAVFRSITVHEVI